MANDDRHAVFRLTRSANTKAAKKAILLRREVQHHSSIYEYILRHVQYEKRVLGFQIPEQRRTEDLVPKFRKWESFTEYIEGQHTRSRASLLSPSKCEARGISHFRARDA